MEFFEFRIQPLINLHARACVPKYTDIYKYAKDMKVNGPQIKLAFCLAVFIYFFLKFHENKRIRNLESLKDALCRLLPLNRVLRFFKLYLFSGEWGLHGINLLLKVSKLYFNYSKASSLKQTGGTKIANVKKLHGLKCRTSDWYSCYAFQEQLFET